jgi:hypothetical protein
VVVTGTVAQVVVVLLVSAVLGEPALQLRPMFGAVVGGLQLLAGAVAAAQKVFAASDVAGLAVAVGALGVQRGEIGLVGVVGALGFRRGCVRRGRPARGRGVEVGGVAGFGVDESLALGGDELDSHGWFERVGEAMVADLGEIKRAVVYSAQGDSAQPVIYNGELSGRQYRTDPAGRRGWAASARFMCVGCLSEPTRVWDHCHAHGFVRAPLCNTCNTRHWDGWQPQHGRPMPSRNLDSSYYR